MRFVWTFIITGILLAATALHATVRIGFGTESSSYYPIDTFYSDSRFQFIIPWEELRLETSQTCNRLDLYLESSAGHNINWLTLRFKPAYQSTLDSLAQGFFSNSNLQTCRQATTAIGTGPGWVSFYLTSSFEVFPFTDLLVDIVMDKSAAGSDSFWRMVPTSEGCVRYGVTNTTAGFNLLGRTGGITHTTRPVVRLGGVERRMPAVVASASQIADPDGLIHADWRVTGRECRILPGVELTFVEGRGLFVEDSFRALGTEGDSVKFGGSNWQGIQANLAADQRLELDYCVIDGVYGSSLIIQGDANGLPSRVSNSTIGSNPDGIGLEAGSGRLELSQVDINGCYYACYLVGTTAQAENVTLRSSHYGLVAAALPADGVSMKRILLHDNLQGAVYVENSTLRLENATMVDNSGSAVYSYGFASLELLNCVFDNPLATYDFRAESLASIVLHHSHAADGLARIEVDATSTIVAGQHVETGPVPLDAELRPLPGSWLIDAGDPLSGSDPDLTRKDIGCFWLDQSAPLALAATDVPEDQGRQLQLHWQASSMDLAQANSSWFYSLWRLDTLFAATRSAQPVVSGRQELEAALATGEPFTWLRDGSAWNWLATIPAAQHADYAQVVETLADRLNGAPWSSELKVLWHAGEVLSESQSITGSSVDNVPPDAPLALAATATDGGLLLHWQPVTTGSVNGVQLPERGALRYRIYEIPAPWAPESAGTLLGTSDTPSFSLPMPTTPQRRFFRVRAEDQL